MFSRIAAVLSLFAVAAVVNGEGCFSGGQSGDCSSIIGSFCNNLGGNMFSGETRTRCFNVNGFKCDMRIINEGGSRVPDVNACFDAMSLESSGCSTGGIKTINGFQFTLDPNTGSC
ncbi:hypothetical protein BD410DRAFT_797168 [Rickenella mellea]|uniref:Glycan binding protein Y3-like domain-containing protein n=1 Tax=Rickenella mellea TaxID=50990 RepID=A0A4Y7PH65_9AGAM|nr:hypothetical protein BD410DRAFT_797168 [Rickenella mellea]